MVGWLSTSQTVRQPVLRGSPAMLWIELTHADRRTRLLQV